MRTASNSIWTRWKAQLVACALAAAGLTAFLMHLGAVDPWLGGIAVPAMVWFAWVAVDLVRAARRRRSASKDSVPRE